MMAEQSESGFDTGAERQPSATNSGQSASTTSIDVEALLNDPRIAKLIDQRVQSSKDQRIAKQEKQIGEFQKQLARMEELIGDGMSKTQALRYMELEERQGSIEAKLGQPTSLQGRDPVGNGKPTQSAVDVDAFLKAVGIDPNDPDVTALYRSGDVTPDALVSLTLKRKTVASQPNPAQASPAGGGQTSREDLMAQYRKEVDALSPGSPEVYDIRYRYRKAGLDI